jgi:hypothetical protein
VFKNSLAWRRYRWYFHDFRMFGLWGALRKHYYMGEAWRRKFEKIFCGKDELGNKYWQSFETTGSYHMRFFEPKDPHWFRNGLFSHAPTYRRWLLYGVAHTPAQVRARGEYGHCSRMGNPVMDIRYSPNMMPFGLDLGNSAIQQGPAPVISVHCILHPDHKKMKEAGFTRWTWNQGFPTTVPFSGDHGCSDELVEEYFRMHWAFGRTSKANDSDGWKQ